ncbi:hypothetical protein V8E55_000133 [Tylopilus felleus]
MELCEPCDRYFQSWSSYRQRLLNSSNHNYCGDCGRDFVSWRALEQHYIQSSRHHYCRQCGTHCEDSDDLESHCINNHFYCDMCDQFFQSAAGLREHNRQSHFYCSECDRVFRSESNLRSVTPQLQRAKNVPCAFQYRGCTQSFVSKSAMILHLEAGSCPSGANRRMIDRWVRVNDRDNVVTVPRRLLTYGDDDIECVATQRSWNGSAYECVLCHSGFRTLDDLNRHLASPRHKEKTYRCPLTTCLAKFSTLSGLCQHVESESCGVLRFRAVRDGMDHLLRDMGTLRITAPS